MTVPAEAAPTFLLDLLGLRGARLASSGIADFGDPDAERAAVLDGVTLHALTGMGLLEISGEDAQMFLQGQLSSDLGALSATRAQLSTYCTPQGRMLATLMVWHDAGRHFLLLPAELAASTAARLRKYVLRAKARIADVTSRHAVFGVGGAGAAAALRDTLGALPDEDLGRTMLDAGSLLRLRSELYIVVVDLDASSASWDRLAVRARPAGTQWWDWRMIQAGIPTLTAATQDRFVPQMAAMDALGAVSFDKGCYPGQEVVARARYRGQVKRSLYRLHTEALEAAAGTDLFEPAQPAATGTVLNAGPAPGGGTDLLAVVLIESARRGDLRVGAPEGPRAVVTSQR